VKTVEHELDFGIGPSPRHVVTIRGYAMAAAHGGARSVPLQADVAALVDSPSAVILMSAGIGDVFSQIAVFFSKMAVVTFGGAYAVLAYAAQAAVTGFGWLRPGEMLDGLGMAETTRWSASFSTSRSGSRCTRSLPR
jgi:Chromate transporter